MQPKALPLNGQINVHNSTIKFIHNADVVLSNNSIIGEIFIVHTINSVLLTM